MDKFITLEKKQLHPHYLKPDKIKSTFSLRLTQTKNNPYNIDDYIKFFKNYKKLSYVMIFEENAKFQHYHIFCLSSITIDAVRKHVKTAFPKIHLKKKQKKNNVNGNNEFFAYHDCSVDKNPMYAPNYVAKDGKLKYKKGFTDKQISTYVHNGCVYKMNQKYQESKNLHNYIAKNYVPTDPDGSQIYLSIEKYYVDKKKVMPPKHILVNLFHRVAYVSSQSYRIRHHNNCARECEKLFYN